MSFNRYEENSVMPYFMVYLYKEMKYVNKIGLGIVFCFLALFILFPHRASAVTAADITQAEIQAATLTWIDRAHISVSVGGQTIIFFDNNIDDSTDQFEAQGYDCFGRIYMPTRLAGAQMHLDMDFKDNPDASCQDTNPNEFNKNVGSVANRDILYYYVDATHIQYVNGTAAGGKVAWDGQFTQSTVNLNLFMQDRDTAATCRDRITVLPNGKMFFYALSGDGAIPAPADAHDPSCKLGYINNGGLPLTPAGTLDLSYAIPLRQADPLVDAGGPAAGGGGGGGAVELNCSFALLNPLTWFMCPLIEGASHAITQLDGQIQNQLTVPIGQDTAFDENKPGVYTAWSVMRSLAMGVLVIIAIVMVLSQAISAGPFDAYTVKKVLPRLVLAVIAVSLSWQLSKLLISISNDLGQGIGSLIAEPFKALGNPKIGAGGQSIGAVAAVAGFFSGIDMFVILSLVLVGLVGVLIAFAVIAFRNILLIMLVIFAPIAIVFWILPNTHKAWEFWEDNFKAVLLAFPIIIVLITVGRVFAVLTTALPSPNSSALFRDLITFIAYFGPYFALPAAFRLAGGAVASLAGVVNDRNKGFFDKQRKFRGERKAFVRKEQKEGNRFGRYMEKNRLTSSLNRGLQIGANAQKAGIRPSRMRANMNSALNTQEHDLASKFMKENTEFASFSADDDKLKAAVHGNNEQEIMDYLQANDASGRFSDVNTRREAAAEILRAKKGASTAVFNKAAVRAMAPTGTAFEDAGEMLQFINAAYGSDRSGAGKALAEMKSASMGAGRADLAGSSYGLTAGAMQNMYNGGNTDADRDAAQASIIRSVYETQGASTLSHPSMKASSVNNLVPEIRRSLQAAYDSGDDDIYQRELAKVANLYDTMASSSPQNAAILADGVMRFDPGSARAAQNLPIGVAGPVANSGPAYTPLPGGTSGPVLPGRALTIQEQIEMSRSNPVFVQHRRELNSQQQLAGQVGASAGGGTPGGGAGGGGAAGGGLTTGLSSDRRLKKDIVLLKVLENGIRLYSFRYFWSDQEYVGVMAQDLLASHPEAIYIDEFGFYGVYYNILGLKMAKIENWQATGKDSVLLSLTK